MTSRSRRLRSSVNFIRPITEKEAGIRCEGRVIHSGGRTAMADGRIVDTAGKLYAHGTTTCLILR